MKYDLYICYSGNNLTWFLRLGTAAFHLERVHSALSAVWRVQTQKLQLLLCLIVHLLLVLYFCFHVQTCCAKTVIITIIIAIKGTI